MRLDTLTDPIKKEQRPALELALASLQGSILRGYRRDRVGLFFLRFQADKQHVRERLHSLAMAEKITSAKRQDEEPDGLLCNLFFTAEGYRHLDPRLAARFSTEFQEGMKRASPRLNDDLRLWEPDYTQNFHAMVLLAPSSPETLEDEENEARKILQDYFMPIIELRPGEKWPQAEWGKAMRVDGRRVEHFGYVDDGISQPLFFQEDVEKELGRGKQQGAMEWDSSAGPNLVLIQDPNGEEDDCGSYLVFRKLEQNVHDFTQEVENLARDLGMKSPDLAGAFAMGRFRDGTPVVVQDTPGLPRDYLNNFSFADDPQGGRCPYHAHIRKLNPRADATHARGNRIVRRGITYGNRDIEPKDNPRLDQMPKKDVGLLFMCYQRDIKRQFEFLQSRWANNTNFLREETGVDPVNGRSDYEIAQRWPVTWGDQRVEHRPFPFGKFVTLKGGEYFFAPSINFLKSL